MKRDWEDKKMTTSDIKGTDPLPPAKEPETFCILMKPNICQMALEIYKTYLLVPKYQNDHPDHLADKAWEAARALMKRE